VPAALWQIPEGLKVKADGMWWVGDVPVAHPVTLLYLKSHLVFDDDGAFVSDGLRRVPVTLSGPPLGVISLSIDPARGELGVVLDDGSIEPVRDGSLSLDERNGRFHCLVRGGRVRAPLSRAAHQRLLELAVEDDGRFCLRVGRRKIGIET